MNQTDFNRKLLVCDDDEDIIEFLAIEAVKLGFDVDFASDGAQAWRKLESESYDMVVTDFKMPGLNGIDLAAQLSKSSPHIHVMLVTGYPSSELEEEATNAGIKKLLLKPLNPDTFQNAILDLFTGLKAG